MFMKSIAGMVSALLLAGTAQAQVAVSIWTNTAAGSNATLTQATLLGAPTATTTVGAINFASPPSAYTVGGFLNNPAGLNSTVAATTLNNTYMLFTGQVFLNAGNNSFVVAHDDGLQLLIDGISGLVVDQPGPTAPVNTPFNVNAPSSGLYNFHLSYGECCGSPATLVWNVNNVPVGGGVPEPASWAMMLLGFTGIGMSVRRRRKALPHFA